MGEGKPAHGRKQLCGGYEAKAKGALPILRRVRQHKSTMAIPKPRVVDRQEVEEPPQPERGLNHREVQPIPGALLDAQAPHKDGAL